MSITFLPTYYHSIQVLIGICYSLICYGIPGSLSIIFTSTRVLGIFVLWICIPAPSNQQIYWFTYSLPLPAFLLYGWTITLTLYSVQSGNKFRYLPGNYNILAEWFLTAKPFYFFLFLDLHPGNYKDFFYMLPEKLNNFQFSVIKCDKTQTMCLIIEQSKI